MKARLQIASAVPVIQTPDEIRAYMDKDRKSLAELIKVANIKFE
jgi:tripartite-type tricarboxylate transporter receptor subunit TctC